MSVRATRLLSAVLLVAASLLPAHVARAVDGAPVWDLPIAGAAVVARFEAPAHRYGPGHRGIDLAPPSADAGVLAPADGVVAFRGDVAGRGVITIDHGGGWVTSIEPVITDRGVGDAVRRGDPIAAIDRGGHAAAGTVHVGVRLHGEYVNPLLLVRGIPRAVLLPCC
ncbi:murein DD-endopeptidase MepM/ murein hydrolase activator NlpD [Microbacterium marinum]|uniref:Murein DD-endopeptidase MepM/ murein hydrolase activator NlpD n=1 Tax=Microbacterium marinum TaxID=421115 RepID=A0A7W7BQZ4_9MICO|nr:M23 family metallopeptidase [Microbacterium marinum]MBB4667200.1 murein DD-endopeptidase MepM/ murein hydrolase activator NlpD [Microbacterium marinum]